MATINAIGSDKPIQVAFGGTGLATLTDHGVLVGSGAAALTPLAAGTNGQPLIGSTGADPVFATLTSANSSIVYTAGAGTLSLEAIGYVSSTYSPTLAFGGASVGITYTTRVGNYIQIGNLVFIQVVIVLSSKGTSVGSATVSLPVNANATASQLNIQQRNITYPFAGDAIASTNVTTILPQVNVPGSGVSTFTNTGFTNTSELYISGIYFT